MTRTNFLEGLSSFRLIHQTGAQRKRVSIGENEKRFIVECYNLCHSNDCKAKSHWGGIAWPRCKDVPGAINATDGLTGRMRNVIKNALRAAQPATQQQRRRV